MQTERARLVRGSRDHAAADVAAQRGERARDVTADRIGRFLRLMPAAAADHHGLAAQLGIAQQLDRCVKRIHVQVRDMS